MTREPLIFLAGVVWTVAMAASLALTATSGLPERGSGRDKLNLYHSANSDRPGDGRRDKENREEAIAYKGETSPQKPPSSPPSDTAPRN